MIFPGNLQFPMQICNFRRKIDFHIEVPELTFTQFTFLFGIPIFTLCIYNLNTPPSFFLLFPWGRGCEITEVDLHSKVDKEQFKVSIGYVNIFFFLQGSAKLTKIILVRCKLSTQLKT